MHRDACLVLSVVAHSGRDAHFSLLFSPPRLNEKVRAANNQKFDASLAATLPRHDADDIMAELNSECNNLYKLAKQSDVEIA